MDYGDEVSDYYLSLFGFYYLKTQSITCFPQDDDDIIAQQAALAQAKFGGLKVKGPMQADEVRFS